MKKLCLFAVSHLLFLPAISLFAQASSLTGKPYALQCDALTMPLGDDNTKPRLSWKLQDTRIGAKQTAYRVLVASKASLLQSNHPDIWDSDRIDSDQSVDVVYAGPALQPETRYYWRVEVWDKDGKPYPTSTTSWWETGLMQASSWTAQWIGYESPEQAAVRAAAASWVTNPKVALTTKPDRMRHDLRLSFKLDTTIQHATLYVTGQDTQLAWINGTQVVQPVAQPAWGRTPWRSYRKAEVTSQLRQGKNTLAIEVIRYSGHGSMAPMNATLYVEGKDGSTHIFKTGTPDWKSALLAADGWQREDFDDHTWATPILYPSPKDAFGNPDSLGIPLPTAHVVALRHAFQIKKTIVAARLYATAMGAYTLHLNGRPVSDMFLTPGWTDFRDHVYYQSYDVTQFLHNGQNVLGGYLAPGWYSTPLEWVGQGNNYGATPAAFRAQLLLTYSDGSHQWVATDSSWKASLSPIVSAEIYDGEVYDARLEQAGWDRSGFSDASWQHANVIQPHSPAIFWQSFQPIRAHQALQPISIKNPKPGVYLYDFGQNLAGVPRVVMHGQKDETVQIRYSELLHPDGTLYTENLRNAKATDRYTFAQSATITYEPSFTYHGFRYMEISGVHTAPANVHAIALYTDAPQSARFSTGDPIVNKLWNNIIWGQRSNFLAAPTDCPQRDERLGWTADAQVFWRTASYNMDLTAYSRKYAADLDASLGDAGMYGIYAPGTGKTNSGFGPGWSDAGVIVPWTSWIQTGDTSIIQNHWDGMSRYLNTILASNPDYLWSKDTGINFGDWLAPEGSTSMTLLATAYWAYDAKLMAQMAHAIGNNSDEKKYTDLYTNIRTAFQNKFVRPGGIVGWPSDDSKVTELQQTQTGYTLALYMDLLPEQERARASDHLVERIAKMQWTIGTGFLGTPYLMEALSSTGHSDIAYRLLFNTQYPSWGYMVDHGATTMWERWNGDSMLHDPGMNSFNHYAYGSVAEWMYRYAAGIDTSPLAPGFHTIMLHPDFNQKLNHLDFQYDSRYGKIHSAWSAIANGYQWTVTIPANTTAEVNLQPSIRSVHLLHQGPSQPTTFQCSSTSHCLPTLQAGTYTFQLLTQAETTTP